MRMLGDSLGKVLCEAVGVNSVNIKRIVIDCSVGDAVMVTTYGYAEVTDPEMTAFREEVKKYKLWEVTFRPEEIDGSS